MCFLYCRVQKTEFGSIALWTWEELWGLGENSEVENKMIFKIAIKINRIVGDSFHETDFFPRVNFIPLSLNEKSVRKQ